MILTVGHSTHGQAAFVELLQRAYVDMLVDVRRSPGSRRFPHMSRSSMATWLPEHAIEYRFEGQDLGGRREPLAGSRHLAISDPSFRAYADHMATSAFDAALRRVVRLAGDHRPAVMCAEGDWRRCHRQYIADALVLLHGVAVSHLLPDGRLESHSPSPAARLDEGTLVYDLGVSPPLPL